MVFYFYFFVQINPQESHQEKQEENMPIIHQEIQEQRTFITLILKRIQRSSCTSIEGIFIVNKINKIGRIKNQIDYKIQVKQKLLKSFSGVD